MPREVAPCHDDGVRIQVVLPLPVKPGSQSCIRDKDEWCHFLYEGFGENHEINGFGCDLFDEEVAPSHDEQPKRLAQCIAAEVKSRPDGTVTWLHLTDAAR
jgi:hypothetical protein